MRSVRTLIVSGLLVVALAACGGNSADDNASSTGSTAGAANPAASADSGPVEIPEIPKGKVTSSESLCQLIPVDKAAKVLGQPTVTTEPWTSQIDPDVLGACNVFNNDDKGTPDEADDTIFGINVFVRTGAAETLKKARQILVNTGDPVAEYTISGCDEAFYARREGNIRVGDTLYVANGVLGVQDEERTMAFLTMLATAAS